MKKKNLTLLLIFICTYQVALSQQIKITGNVKGTDGMPISSATIQLKDLGAMNVISYNFSDSAGLYKLEFTLKPDKQYLLIVSSLGHQRDTVNINILKETVLKYNFVLKEDINQLNEISIKAPPPAIEIVNDTTKYKVSTFTNPSDKNLQDVIKRMPGMEVSRDGTIYFKKRPISKVLLENDDLTSGNYKAITQNVKPELVDEIQAVEHWVEDDLLRGIISSDEVILNLTLKDKRKKKVLGSVDAGYGTNQRYNGVASLISYFDKTKAFGLIKGNNRGASQADMFNLAGANKNLPGDGKIINHQIYSNLPFDDNPLVLNKSLSGSLNTVTRFSSSFKLGASIYSNRNKFFNGSTSTSIYQEPINTIVNDQQQQNSDNKHQQADVTADYLVTKNSRLSTMFSLKARPQHYNSANLSSFNNVKVNEIIQSQNDKLSNYHLGLKYTLKANTSMALIVNANFTKDAIDQNYTAQSALYTTVPVFEGASNLKQLVNTDFQMAQFDIQALKKRAYNYFYVNMGLELNEADAYTNLLNKSSDTAISGFLNNYSFRNNKVYLTGKYSYNNKITSFASVIKTSIVNQNGLNRDSTFLLIEPEIMLSTKIGDFQNVMLGYNYKNIMTNPLEYYSRLVLTDLRSINTGLNNLYNFGVHNFTANYSNTEFTNNYLTFNLNANAQINNGGFISENFFQDEIYYSSKIAYKGNKNYSAGIGFKKLIPLVQSKFSVDYNVNKNDFYGKVEQEINSYSSIGNFVNTSVTTGFKLPVNITAEFQVQSSTTKKETVKFNEQISYKYALQSRYQVTKEIFNLIDYSWYRIGARDYKLLNAEVQYKPQKGIFSYAMYGKNLGNFKSVSAFSVSNVGEFKSSTTVLGRYFLASISMLIQ